jgi:transcriptional regulator with PAS, ATPase and Fis domain
MKETDTSKNSKPVFITQNVIMRDLLEKIKLVARTNANILITGENGTGKEVLTQLYHYYSDRKNKPLVSINCGAIPDELVESELFGHEKGAFTGASNQRKGCFEQANGGVLFLDEIGEMPLATQVKLLRAVEQGSIRRIGGKEDIAVDVNLVSATNRILADMMKSGSFREDLYYRINVIELYVPPLRHRKDDIPLLVSFYTDHFSHKYHLEGVEFDDSCMEIFWNYDWPGNVRELKNSIERSVIFSGGDTISADGLLRYFQPDRAKSYPVSVSADQKNMIQIPIGTSLEDVERRVIEQTLISVDNNKTEAAKILGFARKTLHNKLDKYGESIFS